MIWLLLPFLLVCSGAVSASETALFSLSTRTLQEYGRSSGSLRRRVFGLMQRPRRVLMTILITNTAVNVAFFAVGFVALHGHRETGPTAEALGSAAVLAAVIVFGEMLPKALALSNARRLARPAGVFVGFLHVVLSPLRWALQFMLVDPIIRLVAPHSQPGPVSIDELQLLLEQSAGAGVINPQENEMLQATVALAGVRVREVMTPRVDIRGVGIEQGREAVLALLEQSGRRKLLVFGDNLDDVRGILYARDVYLQRTSEIAQLVVPVRFVPEQINLVQLIRYFRSEQVEFAVVVDEYGGTSGIVSIEDIAERIVGPLPDPDATRPAPTTERIDDNTYRVSGDLSVRLWAERFAVGEIDRHIDTVGGLILAKLGRWPQVGEAVRLRNLTLTVEAMDRYRIDYVVLRREDDVGGGKTEC